jgi:acyl dehydratase
LSTPTGIDGEAALVSDLAGLSACAGRHLGHTEWSTISRHQVSAFAELTGDRNFIHVDPERAARTPFGGTIAHGLLSLALLAPATQRLRVSDASTAVNYGVEKVRFPAPLPVGARWRAGAEILDVEEVKGGMQARMRGTIEVEGSERPVAVAEFLIRFYK